VDPTALKAEQELNELLEKKVQGREKIRFYFNKTITPCRMFFAQLWIAICSFASCFFIQLFFLLFSFLIFSNSSLLILFFLSVFYFHGISSFLCFLLLLSFYSFSLLKGVPTSFVYFLVPYFFFLFQTW
jgi:hypothetical protein